MEINTDLTSPAGKMVPPPLFIRKDLNKEFKRNSSSATMGIVMLVLGFIMLFVLPGSSGPLLPLGICMILISFHAPLKFREDHFTFGAPVGKPKRFDYTAIDNIEYEKKKITIHSKGKKTTIQKGLFSSDDWEEINKTFNSIKPEEV